MNIFSRIKNYFLRKKLLIPEYSNYSATVTELKENIISQIPENTDQLAKAYLIYRELGKQLSEHPFNALVHWDNRKMLSLRHIEADFQGNCKAIAELYVNILKDPRVNIDADLVTVLNIPGAHVDAILKIDNKQYITNLISDLSKIQTGQKVHSFGFDLKANSNIMYNSSYKKKIYKYYKNLSSIPEELLENLDKKFGYSFCCPNEKDSFEPGIYTEDVFQRIITELSDPQKFRKYVLKGKTDIANEDILKYKLEFFFDNMDKFSTYPGKVPNYLENIRYYYYTLKKFFSVEEGNRINAYACAESGDLSNIYSIIRLRTIKNKQTQNDYYMYDKEDKRYKYLSADELHDFLKQHPDLYITGEVDRYNPRDIDDIEL